MSERIPYDPAILREAGKAVCQRWRRLADYRLQIYRDALPWFGPEMVAAGWVDGENEATKMLLQRAHAEWETLTGLPPLCNAVAWRAAAVAVGFTAPDMRTLEFDELVDALSAWAIAKAADRQSKAPAMQAHAAIETPEKVVNAAPVQHASTKAKTGKGGRRRKWADLEKIICKPEMQDKSDEDIAAAYRQTFNRREDRNEVNAEKVREVRDNMKRRQK